MSFNDESFHIEPYKFAREQQIWSLVVFLDIFNKVDVPNSVHDLECTPLFE